MQVFSSNFRKSHRQNARGGNAAFKQSGDTSLQGEGFTRTGASEYAK